MANVKTKSKNRKEIKQAAPEHNDLCMTCNFGDTCVRRKSHNKAVWYCEEFDDFQPAPKKTVVRTAAVKEVKSSELFAGLCVNCDCRDFCLIPKADAGVWHCEEYR